MSSTTDRSLCSPWITGADVAACGPEIPGIGSDVALLDDVAYDASWLLYLLTGRLYPGVCEITVRPCRATCGCWGFPGDGWEWWWGYDSVGGWWWRDRRSSAHCGCGYEDQIRLAGYPVLEILEVKINGETLDELDENGNPNWRLDRSRMLLRMDDPGPPLVRRRWPACQNVALDDDQTGTFSIRYTWGGNPPAMGAVAAAQVARQFWFACNPDSGTCDLPTNVTKIVRQGTTYERVTTIAGLWLSGSTGLPAVDAFIAAVNPNRAKARPVIWSPDVRQFPRRVGNAGGT